MKFSIAMILLLVLFAACDGFSSAASGLQSNCSFRFEFKDSYPNQQGSIGYNTSVVFRPLNRRFRFSKCSDDSVAAPVSGLGLIVYDAAIRRGVISVIVPSVYFQSGLIAVRQGPLLKNGIVLPFVAHTNATSSVAFPHFITDTANAATSANSNPDGVKAVISSPVFFDVFAGPVFHRTRKGTELLGFSFRFPLKVGSTLNTLAHHHSSSLTQEVRYAL